MTVDALELTKKLIACPSITPNEGGALTVLETALKPLGFHITRLKISGQGSPEVENLYARLGDQSRGPHFCFAGHTDVVPPGDPTSWKFPPFDPQILDGKLYGRGASDMKAAIGCFVAAVAKFKEEMKGDIPGSISFLITGDEEGPALNGTRRLLEWVERKGDTFDGCLIGEPSSDQEVGDTIRVGRRGSLNVKITVQGKQGHVAYPELADNPIPRLMSFIKVISEEQLDMGSENYPPSSIVVTNIETDNSANNVIPAQITARFNIRYNDLHTYESLRDWVRSMASAVAGSHQLSFQDSASPFIAKASKIREAVIGATRIVRYQPPILSTAGGTSDGRFISKYCSVIECGMRHGTAHQVDEHVELKDIEILTDIYLETLRRFFKEDVD